MIEKEGAAGVEPATSRSAVECSATELYPQTTGARTIDYKSTKHCLALYTINKTLVWLVVAKIIM